MAEKMLKYCLHVREDLAALKDGFFEAREFYGMKSDLYMYRELRNFLFTQGIDLNTQQVNAPGESDVIICVNETAYFEHYTRTPANKLLVLVLTEPPVYNKSDWDENKHILFDKVFTYNSDLENKNRHKYKYLPYPIDLSEKRITNLLSREAFQAKKHSCLIAGAFAITQGENKNSLLYERYKIMAWYNKYAPGQLDYYGRTRPEPKFLHFRGASLLNRIHPGITKFVANRSYGRNMADVYKGEVPGLNKNETLARYKFNFCFENTCGLSGYITEKIFDCFFSGTVPVYYGAPDIGQYIPKNCFISFTDFSSPGALHKYLAEMDYNTYLQYLAEASEFLDSPALTHFSTDTFIQTLYPEIRI